MKGSSDPDEPHNDQDMEHSDNEDDRWDAEDDPQCQMNDNLFDSNELSNDDRDEDLLRPPALFEHGASLNGYIHVFINTSYKGATHSISNESLTFLHSTIKSFHPNGLPHGLDLDDMARTLRTVEKPLGISTDKLITNYIICPLCWKMYHPSELSSMLSAICMATDCSATLFRLKRTSSNGIKRVPFKVMPAASFKTALARLLMRSGKWDELQHWRKEEDHDTGPPITQEEWYATTDIDTPLHDIHDGWMWRSLRAVMVRIWDARQTKVKDVDIKNLDRRFFSLRRGIIVHINIDL